MLQVFWTHLERLVHDKKSSFSTSEVEQPRSLCNLQTKYSGAYNTHTPRGYIILFQLWIVFEL